MRARCPQEPMTEAHFCNWIGAAMAGDRVAYHQGFLPIDLCGPHLPKRNRDELRRLAGRALWAAQKGLVELVQVRHHSDQYSYVAIARLRRLPRR